jgi:hypothetical protein
MIRMVSIIKNLLEKKLYGKRSSFNLWSKQMTHVIFLIISQYYCRLMSYLYYRLRVNYFSDP